ncbi:MAG: sn-glycerol-3-phosphate import ATP-binding protein UgpC [Betaproteobacteria bacterium]|nr:sn-glycerol-3-phosphate import ATP-binding protein UgpC [Betaproteobacteria bacterium]
MAEIKLNGVKKSYGNLQVVHGVDANIADGEFIVIVGPSGCGKSTLLRMIAGLEAISGGEVSIGGTVVNNLEPKDRDIAMVFQNYALYPHMTVYDNMAYGLKIRKLSAADIETRVQKAAKILELGTLLQRKPRELSGGQRQRVAMGRAIVREPAAFLFDEPLSNLDAKLRVQMRLEIQKLSRELKTTSIFVTHDQVEAMTLAHRMIVMNAGRAEQIGAPMEVYDNPASIFVAGFIGSPAMNFLPGKVVGKELDLGDALRVALPDAISGKVKEGDAVTFGIRPEHLQIGAQGMPFTVENAEALGADSLVHGKIGSHAVVVRADGHVQHPPGTRLAVTPATGKHYFFDTANGKRL